MLCSKGTLALVEVVLEHSKRAAQQIELRRFIGALHATTSFAQR
jgi:hypothetical protein